MPRSTTALTVPILPHTSPEADQPAGLQLPLYPHQLRALNRCLVIEQDGSLGTDFGGRFDYKSRGGCLADAVGTGKTATSIGMVLAGDKGNGGDTLVVAPAHLIPQWKQEIQKFASADSIEVIVGKKEFDQKCSIPPSATKRRIVLVDVDTILNQEKLWYDWRRVFTGPKKSCQLTVEKSKMEVYKKAALFSVQSPKGPCSYEGWVYTGSLHLPERPWRRVIFDEIQDLVAEGTQSQKNLLQLSRTATHVWLLSATPFPHGNSSVYANHELLGFCRLKMDVEVDYPLPANHTFERIKRKLYIRSPRHVADEAVSATVTRHTVDVTQLDLEIKFYSLESGRIPGSEGFVPNCSQFAFCYNSLREMTVHPEASEDLRRQMADTTPSYRSSSVRPVSASVNAAAMHAVAAAKRRLSEIAARDLDKVKRQYQDTKKSLALAGKVQQHRAGPLTANPFTGPVSSQLLQAASNKEAKLIHDHYCTCPDIGSRDCFADRHVRFRVVREEGSLAPEFIQGQGSLQQVIQYFRNVLGLQKRVTVGTGSSPALQNYVAVTLRTVDMRKKALQDLEIEKRELTTRVETLSKAATKGAVKHEDDALARTHGSKPAALVRFLQTAVQQCGEKVIVFSYWHDTLKLVGRTLRKCGLQSVFCGGNGSEMSAALQAFITGSVPIILLSAKSKASGANLQCATHVVLLDPAGSSAEHGSTLEEQAIGRAVRMGQERPVTVTRFCVLGTIEEHLFEEIDEAATRAKTRASDSSYVIQDSHKSMPKSKKPAEPAVEDDSDIKLTAAISGEERIRREFLEAEEKGDVIDLLDDSDEEENKPPKKTTSVVTTPSAGGAAVKQESMSNKRDQGDPSKCSDPKRMRTDEHTPCSNLLTISTQVDSQTSSCCAVTPHEAVNNRKERVSQLLQRLDLTEYEAKFVSSGYDSLDWLYSVSDNLEVMEKLATTVGFKPGHAIRFQLGLAQEAADYGTVTDV